MDSERVLDLLARLDDHGVPVWIEGGWGIDALLGRQTRLHDDLDLVARLVDADGIKHVLGELGYTLEGGGAPLSFELVDAAGHQVDVHPASFTPTGDGVYRLASGEDWVYPAAGFAGVGRILGREVPCLTPEVMLLCHSTGYTLDEDHRRDAIALSEEYGLPLPVFLVDVRDIAEAAEQVVASFARDFEEVLTAAEVHHIGATALPSGRTKADVDVNVRVDEGCFATLVDALRARLPVAQPQNWSPTFASFAAGGYQLPLGVQVTVIGSADDFLLALRDRMREDPELLRRYDDAKVAAAAQGRAAYWRAKDSVLRELL